MKYGQNVHGPTHTNGAMTAAVLITERINASGASEQTGIAGGAHVQEAEASIQ